MLSFITKKIINLFSLVFIIAGYLTLFIGIFIVVIGAIVINTAVGWSIEQ